jgi:hypothetical protein
MKNDKPIVFLVYHSVFLVFVFFQNFPNFQKINKSDWSVYLNQTDKKIKPASFCQYFNPCLGGR